MKYYKRYRRGFNWKYEAENFASKVKSGAKKLHYRVDVHILPMVAFSSSSTQRWSLLNKIAGAKNAETKTTGYVVEWVYKPSRKEAGKR